MTGARNGCRRFTILDGMILIAATAVGLAWVGRVWPGFLNQLPPARRSWAWGRDFTVKVTALATPVLMMWTWAILLLRLRGPRPGWRRVTRQPGMTACLSALILFAIVATVEALVISRSIYSQSLFAAEFWRDVPGSLLEFLALGSPFIGLGVALSWLLMAVQRGWRSEPSWIDRAGRAIGLLWVATTPILGTFLILQWFS
ncbi:MAG: hypothetical protein JWN86_2008 [Planctomycetota bacterium]|nr:hypothetical protein [Planctomycetota bacterium]